MAMASYTIQLHDGDGAVRETHTAWFDHDDDAIDHTGRIAYPQEIKVWQGERLVARFPPAKARRALA